MGSKGKAQTLEEVGAKVREKVAARQAERVSVEAYECVACSTKFYRSRSFAAEVAEWKDPICFDCFVQSLTGETDVIAFAFKFAEPRIRHAFMMKGQTGWRFVVVRMTLEAQDSYELMTRAEFDFMFRGAAGIRV